MENRRALPDGYCGLYCGACPNFLATRRGTVEAFMKETGLPRNEVECDGCRGERNIGWCSRCGLKACARSKGLEFCSQCQQYPCRDLETFKNQPEYPYHSEIYDYLEIIRGEGKAIWLEKMKERWSCPGCGREASWWDLTCQDCGRSLKGYQKPA